MIKQLCVWLMLALGILVLAGCGQEPTSVPIAPTATTAPAAAPTLTIPAADVTPTPAAATPAATPGSGGSTVQIQLAHFSIWQDFMPGPGDGGPPLRAAIELDITNNGQTAITEVAADRLVLRRAGGEVVYDGAVTGGDMNMGPAAGLPPGASKHYVYSPAQTDVAPQLTENEPLSGTLTLKIDAQEHTVDLPATPVTFTH
jgi:hypothetical protein